MSHSEDFLIFLTSYHKGYKLMRARMGGYQGSPEALFLEKQKRKEREVKDSTYRATLSRLKKQGMIERNDFWWCITEKGRNYLQKRLVKNLPMHSKLDKSITLKRRSMIVIFDIPEKLHRKRDWLRYELTQLGFVMLQKSVWFGSAPLPKIFLKNINDLGILRFLRFFRADEANII